MQLCKTAKSLYKALALSGGCRRSGGCQACQRHEGIRLKEESFNGSCSCAGTGRE